MTHNFNKTKYWLAPLRGVTIRAFREAFANPIREYGFIGAFTPFIPANPGIRVTDRLLDDIRPFPAQTPPGDFTIVPQVISKDAAAMRILLKGFKDRGFKRADLNAGCPFPMIRRRGRGSGLLKTPENLERLIEAGCDEMGADNFSLKIRLGLDSADELAALMPMINRYPLAVLTVHARTARQMYEGKCDIERFKKVAALSVNPVMYNGDSDNTQTPLTQNVMIGRSFIRSLGNRDDCAELLTKYIEISKEELCGDRPVLGRIKELLSYWNESAEWRRLWPSVKICRTLDELYCVVRMG